jgi:hypothetical protein
LGALERKKGRTKRKFCVLGNSMTGPALRRRKRRPGRLDKNGRYALAAALAARLVKKETA